MKKTIFLAVIFVMMSSVSIYALDGDLIVNGKLGVGQTAPSYPLDISTQGVSKSASSPFSKSQ